MTSTFPDISISTERLVLRALDEDDVPALTEMMNDEMVAAWTSIPQPFTEDGARDWIADYAPTERARGRGLDLAVTEFLTQRLVGVIQLGKTNWRVRSTELSYIIAPWARGEDTRPRPHSPPPAGSSASRSSSAWNCARPPSNTASQQVAQKIGCISEGVLRNACIARTRTEEGTWVDLRTDFIVWSLLPEDLDGMDGQHLTDTGRYSSFNDWN